MILRELYNFKKMLALKKKKKHYYPKFCKSCQPAIFLFQAKVDFISFTIRIPVKPVKNMLVVSILHKSVMMMRQPRLLHKLFASVPQVVMRKIVGGWDANWSMQGYFRCHIFGAIHFLHLLQQHFGCHPRKLIEAHLRYGILCSRQVCSPPCQLIPNLFPHPVIMKFQRNVAKGTLTSQ